MLERYGRNRGPLHREGCGIPQNGTPRDTVHLHRRPPLASTSYCSSPSTSSSLHLQLFIHGLLFIQPPPHATPPATVQPALSTGSCSTTPPRATVHPALHWLLFNQPSTGYCSTSPPRGPIHLALQGVLFIQRQRPLLPRVPMHPTPTRNCSSKPSNNASLFIQRQHRSASVSTSSEGITRVQLTARDRSIARVQLEPNASLGFS